MNLIVPRGTIFISKNMAGIYIHVPFCVSRCGYCDFYKVTNFDQKEGYVEALLRELELRRFFLEDATIETLYFGGGTPSTLSLLQIERILKEILSLFVLSDLVEITVECNPDDITTDYLIGLKKLGVNRLSIGIQSFDDEMLRFMQRRHNSLQSLKAIELAKEVGFKNISIDLIYGLPNISNESWIRNVKIALELQVSHLSAYHLTIEKGTAFEKLLQRGVISEVDEENSVKQFDILLDLASKAGFEQYEISNFCKDGLYSKHNSNYWFGVPYLGLGPSAHSYNGKSRYWNVSDLSKYLQSLSRSELPFQEEILSDIDIFNETLMIGLRTKWGVDINRFRNTLSPTLLNHFNVVLESQLSSGNLYLQDGFVKIESSKFMVSDTIISNMFYL